MKLTVIGTGYVGLVTGACFADSGNEVVGVDIDRRKIDRLQQGEIPIYEPGLTEMVVDNQASGRLRFTNDLQEGLRGSAIVIIGVGTPQSAAGAADLTAVWSVIDAIRDHADGPKIVVIKSTVPVGTNTVALARINQGSKHLHQTASNPEFLKEGCALDDFQRPDRVVVGVRSPDVADKLRELYAPFLRSGRPFLVMSPESAEMTKYVANCMLAVKISFINEMANLCEKLQADINDVRQGIGHDQRIGFQFLHPGVGYGGSCFPKDVRAMIALAEANGLSSRLLQAVDDINEDQKKVLFAKIVRRLGPALTGKTVALWGLAFKPKTDDVREAPALVLIDQLLQAGARVQVHDPKAHENVHRLVGDRIVYCERAYDAAAGADLLAIVTEWQEFRNPDFALLKSKLRQPIIVDGRNLYEPAQMAKLGFQYEGIGRH